MPSEKSLKLTASIISILLLVYLVFFHIGLLLVIIGISFLIVIGVLLLLKKFKNLLGDGD